MHSFPDKWHLKSNDFFLFCGQEYLIHFSFQQCTKSSCKEMEGKEMTPLFRIWVRDVVYSLIPCWLFVINTTPLHSWSCLGVLTNYVDFFLTDVTHYWVLGLPQLLIPRLCHSPIQYVVMGRISWQTLLPITLLLCFLCLVKVSLSHWSQTGSKAD